VLKFSSSIDNINKTTFDVNVYPNPFNGIANISIKGSNSKFASLKVIAQNGQEVFNGSMTNLNSDFPIDLSHLSKGIYILNIELDGQINSKKITIK
jgi:ribosomal protein L2